jgi:hypothetical protein
MNKLTTSKFNFTYMRITTIVPSRIIPQVQRT